MKDVMLWSGLTSFLMSPNTMHGSQADTTRARTLGFSYTGYPELRICSNPPPASLMIPVLYAKVERKHQKRTTVKAVLSENSLFCIEFRNVVNETFGIFPTKARICNRLTINVIAD